MTPSIGRIVHYVSADDKKHLPAIIVEVHSWDDIRSNYVDLVVFASSPVTPAFLVTGVVYNEMADPRSWHWPEREAK